MAAAYLAAASVFAAGPRLLTRVPLGVLAAAAIVTVALGVGGIILGISVFPWSDLVVAAFALAAGTCAGRAVPPQRRPMAIVLAILAVLDSAQVFAAGPAALPPSPFRQWTMLIVPGVAGSAIGFADLAVIAMIGEHWRRRGGNVLLSVGPGVGGLALAVGFVAFGIRGAIPLVPFLLVGWAVTEVAAVAFRRRPARVGTEIAPPRR